MKIKELGIDGKDVGNIEVSDNIFSLKPRKDIIKMVVDWQISRHSKKLVIQKLEEKLLVLEKNRTTKRIWRSATW